jgi:hypothetical protein
MFEKSVENRFMVTGNVAWIVVMNLETHDVDLYIAPVSMDGIPSWGDAMIADDIENWEGTDWANRLPTRTQIRLRANHIWSTLDQLRG